MRQRQRGAALIVALLIVTLAASTAAFAIWQQSLWVRQLENVTDRAKADQLAAGGIDLARNVLKDDKADTSRPPNVDSLNEPWASAIVLPAEDVTLSGQIVDAQGRFNINNLWQASTAPQPDLVFQFWLKSFVTLLDSLKVPKAQELSTAAADWIKDDQNGLTDLQYLALDPPYTAPRRPILDIAELARVKGFDADIIRTIAPYVTAIDTSAVAPTGVTTKLTPVNINTASAEVLAAVTGLSLNQAQIIVKQRDSTPYRDLGAFNTAVKAASPNATCPNAACDVQSNYFLATIRVKSGRIEAGYTVLLDRSQTTTPWPSIKWRKEAAD